NALKANEPAQCRPSICMNFVVERQITAQTLRDLCLSRSGMARTLYPSLFLALTRAERISLKMAKLTS
ncbi:MAG: hypothetical protein PF961_20400, partial [Planctomycetota bacterium]|nr:hypothetical protein [Planctomycetota bacterium]